MKHTLQCGLSVGLILLGAATLAVAGPLDPSQVPADAKWLIHIDVEEARSTTFAQETAQEAEVQGMVAWIQERYGIDVGNDLADATLFGLNYEPHTGIVLLDTNYDRDKVIDVINDEPDYKTSSRGDETLHSWTVTNEWAEPGAADRSYTTFAVLQDDRIVMGRSEEQIKKALDVLKGDGKSIKGTDSPLTVDVRDGTFFRGAAVDLGGLRERPGFASLPQTNRITVAMGEDAGKFFLNADVVAQNAEVAQQIKNVIEGFRSMFALQVGEQNQDAAELANAVKVQTDDNKVTINWEVESEKLVSVAQEAKQMGAEIRKQRKGRSAGRPQPQPN